MRIECLCGTYSHRLHLWTLLWTPNKPSHACAVKPEVLKSWSLEIDYSSGHSSDYSSSYSSDYSSRVWVLTKARGLDQVSVVDDAKSCAKRRRRQQKTRDKEDLAGQAFWDLFPQCLASIQDACTRCFLRGTEKVDFGE